MTSLKLHPARCCRFPAGPLLKEIEELDDAGCRQENAVRLRAARVVFADIELLRNDFPELRGEKGIEAWLLDRAAVISESQAAQNHANSPIPATGSQVLAYRPTRYGRTLVVPTRDRSAIAHTEGAALLEVKGAGVAPGQTPRRTLHQNGLMQLGEALQDSVLQWLIEAIFWHSQSDLAAVPLYAILDAGFDVYTSDGRPVPAGLQVRRAHRRPPLSVELPEPGSPEEALKGELEILLRHYGVTGCNSGTRLELSHQNGVISPIYNGRFVRLPGQRDHEMLRHLTGLAHDWTGSVVIDGINIQLTREIESGYSRAQVVDFGHYSFRDRFQFPLLSLVRERPLMWGSAMLPDHPYYAQPVRDLRIPFQLWSGAMSWDLADRYRSGVLSADGMNSVFAEFLSGISGHWGVEGNGATAIADERVRTLGSYAAERARLAGGAFSAETRRLQGLLRSHDLGLQNDDPDHGNLSDGNDAVGQSKLQAIQALAAEIGLPILPAFATGGHLRKTPVTSPEPDEDR